MGALGGVLEHFGLILERLGGVLERLGRVLGRLGAENEPSWARHVARPLRIGPGSVHDRSRLGALRRRRGLITSKEEGNLLKENIQKIFGTLQTRLQRTQTRS